MPESKLHGPLIKKLSIIFRRVAEFSVILVGLLIIDRSDLEYIVFRNEVALLSLLRRSILKSSNNVKS